MDWLFCKIASGEVSAHIIYEDDKTSAFLDIEPSSLGHTMVVPKEHYQDFMDLPVDNMDNLFGSVQKVVDMLGKTFGADHFTIGVNSGKILGRHVDHLHVHVIPRFSDDGGVFLQGVVKSPPKESLEEIKDKILKANG
ncbi:HIT family protein [Patescibacteria group bacterium]|nr:HIT family protein [Patescibacteria group bacterium]